MNCIIKIVIEQQKLFFVYDILDHFNNYDIFLIIKMGQ